MYELFFTLDDFLAAAQRWGAEVHLLAMTRRLPHEGLPHDEVAIYLTARVPIPLPPPAPDLLAGRLVVERFEVVPRERETALYAASNVRAEQALACVRAAVTAIGRAVVPYGSVVTEPGLLRELLGIHTAHGLWTPERPDPHDPTTWRLVPAAAAPTG